MIYHAGGIVGVDSFPSRVVPSAAFANAPRLHSGLRSDEIPAILQKGEQVIPKDETVDSGSVNNVNIYTLDTVTMQQWVMRNKRLFANANYAAIKSNHPAGRYKR